MKRTSSGTTRTIAAVVVPVLVALAGCVEGTIRDHVRELPRALDLERRATVPHPRYGASGIAALASLRAATDGHIAAIVSRAP